MTEPPAPRPIDFSEALGLLQSWLGQTVQVLVVPYQSAVHASFLGELSIAPEPLDTDPELHMFWFKVGRHGNLHLYEAAVGDIELHDDAQITMYFGETEINIANLTPAIERRRAKRTG